MASWSPVGDLEIAANTPPGGGTDRAARGLQAAIATTGTLDPAPNVVNVVGKTSTGWCDAEARSGDAHRVGISSQLLATDVLTGELPAGAMDWTPLAILYTEYLAFVVDADSALNSGTDILTMLADGGRKIEIAIATSLGNPNYIALAEITAHAGGDIGTIGIRVFNSARLAVASVLERETEFAVVTAASAVPEMKSAEVRTVSVSAPTRLPGIFEAAPTWRELDVECVRDSWRGIGGPAELSEQQIAFWRGLCREAVATDAWRDALARNFWTELHIDGKELTAYPDAEFKETADILQQLGLAAP